MLDSDTPMVCFCRPVEKAQETKAVVPDSIYNVPVRRCSEAINLLRATHYSYRQLTYRAPSPYPEAIAAPFTNDRRPRRAHSSKLAHGLRKVVRKRRYVALTVHFPQPSQLAPLPAQPVLRGEHSLHCRTPARHLLLICFTLIPFLCPQVHRLIHRQRHEPSLLFRGQTFSSHRTLLAVFLMSDILITSISTVEGPPAQDLTFRTHKVVAVIGKAPLGNHAVFLG